jgi:mono/diheme cytochrome c family protein
MTTMHRLKCFCRYAAFAALLTAIAGCEAEAPMPPRPGAVRAAPDPDAVRRGAYLANAANCAACHTATPPGAAPFAGGGKVPTPFGTYYGSNITPDVATGIGAWSDDDFLRALRYGVSPRGDAYFPAFPYTSFTLMTDRDIRDLKAYLSTLPPVTQASRAHDAAFPYNSRALLGLWRALYFKPGPLVADPAGSPEWNRGRYLVEAVLHCGECHTPRDRLGGRDESRHFAGYRISGPEGFSAPNISGDPVHGIGSWSQTDIAGFLQTGIKPDGDVVGSRMSEVIEGASRLSATDRGAVAAYLKSLPPTH